MFQHLFSIRTDNQELASRGRLLKTAALVIGLGSVLFLPISSLAGMNMASNIAMVVVSLCIFLMAHYGWVYPGAFLLIAGLLASISFGAEAPQIAQGSVGVAFIIPVLVAGLVLGATAVLVTGLLSLLSIVTLVLSFTSWSVHTWFNILLLIISSGLIWLIIRTLEHTVNSSRRQAEQARSAHEELRAREQQLMATNEELQNSNQQMEALLGLVRELEIPVIPLLEGVLVVPLVGHLDTRRVDQINHTVLHAVYEQRASIVIIDITGISVVDTAVAQRIEHLAQSIQLLGARVMLTGIKADVAQTIIDLGLNLQAVKTAGRLQDGVATVLSEMSRQN